LKIAVVVRSLADVAALVRLPQVAHEAPARDRRVDLERCREHHVLERQARTASVRLGFRLRDALAEIAEQHLEPILLRRLRGVVRRPLLRVRLPHRLGHAHGFRDRRAAVEVEPLLDHALDGVDVLAAPAVLFMVGTRAARALADDDGVLLCRAGLRGDDPSAGRLPNLARRCDFEAPLLAVRPWRSSVSVSTTSRH